MALTDATKPPKAYDGVVPATDGPAKCAVVRARTAADAVSGLVQDQRHIGEVPAQSLAEVDAAIAEDADGVIESVFASVEELLGDSVDDEGMIGFVEETPDDAAMHGEALEEGVSPDCATNHQHAIGESDADPHSGVAEPPLATDREQAQVIRPYVSEQATPTSQAAHVEALWRRLLAPLIATSCGVLQRRRLIGVAVFALSMLSWPLRLAPEWARPYVDWLALSLVFWVPVIWVIALFVIGRS